jgi:hypothetical protein
MENRAMRSKLVIVFAVVVGFLMAVPLVAHHTASTLYLEKTVTIKGVVKVWRWTNPHCLLTIDVTGADGQVVEWLAETQAPNTAMIQGYRAKSFKAGDEVTLTLRPAANGKPYGLLDEAILADGTKIGAEDGARGRGAAAQ